MSLINRIESRLVTNYQRARFKRVVKGVLETCPLSPGHIPFVALSMVQHRDVLAYLVAIKSFYKYVPSTRVVVVCDPTLTRQDRELLAQHIPHIELRDAQEFRHNSIPSGGTWERLYAITTYTPENYVVQIDADTVCTAPLGEVVDAIKDDRGFVLGEEIDQQILTLAEIAANAQDWDDKHIQAVAEKTMVRIFGSELLYMRGCSGFTGFSSNPSLKESLLYFSEQMESIIGKRWSEWGTEQVASNYLVANLKQTEILPFPKYSTPPVNTRAIAFHHYIGYIRYKDSRYSIAAASAIRQLLADKLKK